MIVAIPSLYADYGRYINKYRAIPGNVDCLKLVERRLLLTLYRHAANKFVKSANIVGAAIRLHPHGDQTIYQSLVHLVRKGYAIGQGNWGSPGIEPAEAAAYRYTECKLAPWVKELCFRYIDYVPWDMYETDEKEPRYLPCPIPIGLIGKGIIQGISFYKTVIPQYSAQSLFTRLKHLLAEEDVSIKPQFAGCILSDNSRELVNKSKVSVKCEPIMQIQDDIIHVYGAPPNVSLTNLFKIENAKIVDASKDTLHIQVIPLRKSHLNDIAKSVKRMLTGTIHYHILVVDELGRVVEDTVDNMLLRAFNRWSEAVRAKLTSDLEAIQKRVAELQIVKKLKQHLNVTDVAILASKCNVEESTVKQVLNKYKLYDLVFIDKQIEDANKEAATLRDKLENFDTFIQDELEQTEKVVCSLL